MHARVSLADFDRAIELEPRNAEAYRHRALVFFRQKEYERGLTDAREGLRLDPKDTGVAVIGLVARAVHYADQKRWQEALADLDEVLRLEPRNAAAWQKRGSVHYNTKDFDQAIADLTRSIEIDPTVANSYLYRSYAYRAKGQTKEARADLEKSHSLQAAEKP